MAVGLITEAEAGRGDRGLRQGRHGRAGARHALRPALGLARGRRTRRRGVRSRRNTGARSPRRRRRCSAPRRSARGSATLRARHRAARAGITFCRDVVSTVIISATRVACYALACARQTRFEKRTARGNPMEIGYFTMPSHPPECGLKEGHDWDLQTLRWLDELGYQEAWIGEHHTAPWEPHPSPDLLLAQALRADQEHPPRPRRLPVALSPPGRTRQPRRDARPSLRAAA